MPGLLDKICELRMKYGPLIKLAEKSSKFLKFVESRPLLRLVLEKLRPQPLMPEDFVDEFQRLIANAGSEAKIVIYSPYLFRKAVNKYLGVMESAIKRGC